MSLEQKLPRSRYIKDFSCRPQYHQYELTLNVRLPQYWLRYDDMQALLTQNGLNIDTQHKKGIINSGKQYEGRIGEKGRYTLTLISAGGGTKVKVHAYSNFQRDNDERPQIPDFFAPLVETVKQYTEMFDARPKEEKKS